MTEEREFYAFTSVSIGFKPEGEGRKRTPSFLPSFLGDAWAG